MTEGLRTRRLALATAGGLVWALLPLLLGGRLSLSVFVLIELYTAIVVGLSLLAGHAGQVSLGHAAFYGLGAYVTGILTVRLGWSPWLGIAGAALGTGFLAYLLGVPILLLRGHYLVVATLGLNIIVEVLFRQVAGLTGGPNGLAGIPGLSVRGVRLAGDLFYYYAAGVLALGAMALSANLVRSRFGRALQAIHASEVAAQSLGVSPAPFKVRVFVWSAVLAGLSGALYAHWLTFISPSPFTFTFSVELLMMTVVGGIASVPGASFGAALAVLLREGVRDVLAGLMGNASAEYEIVVFGVLLALIAIFAPQGLGPRLGQFLRRLAPPAPVRPARLSAIPPTFDPVPLRGVPVLEVDGLTRRFGGLTAVSDLSLRVEPGEIFCIIGPNGAGKTTLFNLISGVLTPSSGRISILGCPVAGLPAHRVAALGVARTFQTPRLVPSLSALENVQVGLHRHLRSGFLSAVLRMAGAEEHMAAARALGALEMVGLAHRAHQPAGTLPFGAQRLVELARALVSRPRLLLLDEPASGLTAEERRDLAHLIRRIRAAGVAVILAEHDVPLVMELADRVLMLHHGERIAEGDPAAVREDPRVVAAYLGGVREFGERAGAGGAPDGRLGEGTLPVLRVQHVSAGYGPVRVLHDVSLEVRAGEAVAVLGPNGAGKSTLMRAIIGLIPARGRVELDGQLLTGLPPEQVTALGVSLVSERRQLLESMTVQDHLVLGAYPRLGRTSRRALEEDLTFVYELFPVLRERPDKPARSLSGGQQQMLAIARALMARPRFLLLDEPFLGLAPRVVNDILETVVRLRRQGLGIVIVEQNTAAVLPVVDRTYVLENGRIALPGTTRLLGTSELETVFLGTRKEGGEVRGAAT